MIEGGKKRQDARFHPLPIMDHLFLATVTFIAVFMAGISGVSVAIDKGYDLFGVAVLGFATAIGGGTLRDMMIGAAPVAWMSDNVAIIGTFAGIVAGALFLGYIEKLRWWSIVFDSAGMGAFTLIGVGPPGEEIIAAAERIDAEAIIVGYSDKTAISRVLLGTVSEHVLRKSGRTVIIVH